MLPCGGCLPDPAAMLRDLARAADVRALSVVYAAVSVDPEGVRAWLRLRGLPFLDPAADQAPRIEDVDLTADHVIVQGQATTAALGAFAGVAGFITVPPEVAAWIVACLRLAQRLSVVYGFDPRSDRGHMALSRAVAAGFQTDLPERGLVELRVSDLARALARRTSTQMDSSTVGARLARAVVVRSAVLAAGRLARLLPVVSSGVGASENHRVAAEVGGRMKTVLRRLAEAPPSSGAVVEAVEVFRAGR